MKTIKFKIFDCSIEFSFYFFAVCSIFILNNMKDFFIAILLSILHECGHIFAILISKKKIYKIKINAFSVDIVQNNFQDLPYLNEFFILLSGPGLNIIFSALLVILYKLTGIGVLRIFGIQSFFIGFVNLFPICSLDGGQIFFLVLQKFFDDVKSERILFLVSIFFIVPMMTTGFYIFLRSYNFSILVLSIYLSAFLIIREPRFFMNK